jgi:hypothetical protein
MYHMDRVKIALHVYGFFTIRVTPYDLPGKHPYSILLQVSHSSIARWVINLSKVAIYARNVFTLMVVLIFLFFSSGKTNRPLTDQEGKG